MFGLDAFFLALAKGRLPGLRREKSDPSSKKFLMPIPACDMC
jgi:hypothetical protein